ncbi:urease accessory protein UreD [Oerskovia sp. M15]
MTFGPGTSAHVTTSAYTKVYRMEHDYAVAQTNIEVAADAYTEFLPDPVIPFADSRLYQRTRVTLDESATLLAGRRSSRVVWPETNGTATRSSPRTSRCVDRTGGSSRSTACG